MLNGAKKSKEFLITVKEIMKPNQEMKQEIKLKKGHANTFLFEKGCNVKSLEIDENGKTVSIDWHEEEKPALKAGEWYKHRDANWFVLKLDEDGGVGFNKGLWMYQSWCSNQAEWQPADMQEVKELLIKEAEKRGFKEDISVKSALNECEYPISDNSLYTTDSGLILDGVTIFNFNTGKWAEIVKKPIYVNSYGTEFFEGEGHYTVDINNSEIVKCHSQASLGEHYNFTEAMTKKECYQYLADNCKE